MYDVNAIRRAIPHGVVPFFQPIIDIADQVPEVVSRQVPQEALNQLSYEALGRLYIGGQMLLPGEFLPIIEGTALMVEFDRKVTAKSIRQVAIWNVHRSNPLHLHVNASTEALSDPGYVHFIWESLHANEFAPELLTVEVVETCSFWKRPDILNTLSALRWLGVNLAIDDFPCWPDPLSLLRYLKRQTIGFGAMKLDRPLIHEVCRKDVRQRKFDEVARYLEIAHGLGMKVVAEGIENSTQSLTMQLMGADSLQGFGIGLPAPSERAHHLLCGEGNLVPNMVERSGRDLLVANS